MVLVTTTKGTSSSVTVCLVVSGISFAAGIALALAWDKAKNDMAHHQLYSQRIKVKPHMRSDENDLYYLQRCHTLRLSLSKPRHSQFRVICLLLLDNGDCIMGANDEPAVSVGGALCAERAAMLAYRTRYGSTTDAAPPQICGLYIVSDHPTMPLPPGCLCREYLYGHVEAIPHPQHLRIVLQSSDATAPPQIVTLPELYPFASVVARCRTVQECVVQCERLQPQLKDWWEQYAQDSCPPPDPHIHMSWDEIQQLVNRAQQAAVEYSATTTDSSSSSIAPLAYGAAAAVVIQNGNHEERVHYITAYQWTAQEYGCTQDAVCQLLSAIRQFVRDSSAEQGVDDDEDEDDNNNSQQPITAQIRALVQVDARYGLPHAPFAPARSALVEFGFAQVPVVVATCDNRSSGSNDQDNTLHLQIIRAVELVPCAPKLPTEPLVL